MKRNIAVYDQFSQAKAAADDLVAAGFMYEQISLIVNDANDDYQAAIAHFKEEQQRVEEISNGKTQGALAGTFFGGLAGVQAGLIAIAAAGLGPVAAAGGIAAMLAGGAIGAAAGGLTGAFVGMNINPEEAEFYTQAVHQGASVLMVESEEEEVSRVTEILKRHQPIDIDQRLAQWQETGWTRPEPEPEVKAPTEFPLQPGNR